MRRAFIDTLGELAAADERVLLLTGDLGYMVMEGFRERFPRRFVNAGVCEQNMLAMATGLAEAGFIPYVYSIATFVALRAMEFIRNGPVLHRLPVRIVGMGMGFEYGHAGPTHHAVEDVAMLRNLLGLTIVIPADHQQAGSAVRATFDHPGPVYLSLGKDDRTVIPGLNRRFELGKAQVIRPGNDIAIVVMGSITAEAVRAAAELHRLGTDAAVIVVSSFNPDPAEHLGALLAGFERVVSVEAQAAPGGLAAFVSSVIATQGLQCRLTPLAVWDSPDGTSGSQEDRWRKHGLDAARIVVAAASAQVARAL